MKNTKIKMVYVCGSNKVSGAVWPTRVLNLQILILIICRYESLIHNEEFMIEWHIVFIYVVLSYGLIQTWNV